MFLQFRQLFTIFLLTIFSSNCAPQETNSTSTTESPEEIFPLIKTTTSVPVNESKKEMQRITQPSQTKKIERTLTPSKNFSKSEKNSFRPSPQLDSHYEFNRFPVAPAYPEAKQFGNLNNGEIFGLGEDWPVKPNRETSWTSKVKFPSDNDRPYQFYNHQGYGSQEKAYPLRGSSKPSGQEGFAFNKPVPVHEPKPSLWDMFGFKRTRPIKHELENKPNYAEKTSKPSGSGYNLIEHPEYHEHRNYGHGLSTGYVDPWKKLVKILATFIPIGLLISALTPSVITVSNVNDTMVRYRSEDAGNKLPSLRILEQLNNRCQQRILCELLLSASISQNAEENVKNMLDNFSEQEENWASKVEELKRIFDAVRNKDCLPIVCEDIKNPT